MKAPPDLGDFLKLAAEALYNETGIKLTTLDPAHRQVDAEPDALMLIERDEIRIEVCTEIKPEVRDVHAGQIANRFAGRNIPCLLVTRYIPLTLAKTLRKLNVQFVDTAGNVHITIPPLQVFICGNKPADLKLTRAQKGLFTTGGVKIVFALLCDPLLKDATYRQIADVAGVAVGTVNTVMKRLQYQQYLFDLGNRGRRLRRKRELLDRWVVAYAEQLRPKQLIGRYQPAKEVDWVKEEGLGDGMYWGGETAAAKLTHYLKPLIATIYTQRPVKNLMLQYKLRTDDNGLVEVREMFWNFKLETPIPHITPPLLIYADLMAHPDPRNVETAKLIYDDYLAEHYRED